MYLPLAVVVCAAAFLMRILFPKGLNRAARFDMDMFLCRVGELVVFVRRGQITRVGCFRFQKNFGIFVVLLCYFIHDQHQKSNTNKHGITTQKKC
jgi:hypothetical protein